MAGKTLADGYLELRARTDKLDADVRSAVKQLNLRAQGHKAGADLGDGFVSGFADRSSTLARVAATSAARLTLLASAASAAAPAVLQLTAALAPAAGALLAVPVAMLAVKAASGVVSIAVAGVGKAIETGLTGTSKEAAEALKTLPAGARAFAQSVIGLRGQLDALRTSVSNRFFLALGNDIRPLAAQYLPMLNRMLSDVAGTLGGLADEFTNAAQRGVVFGAVRAVLDQTANAVVRLRGGVEPLVLGFASLIKVTAPFLPRMALWLADSAAQAGNFLARFSQSGQAVAMLRNGAATLRELGAIFLNVGSIIGSVYRAANAGGNTLLGNLRELTGQAAAFFRSAQGSSALTSVFGTLSALGQALRTSLGAVLPAIAQSIRTLAPAIQALAPVVTQFVVALAPLLPYFAQIAAVLLRAAIPALTALARYLSENQSVLRTVAVAVGVAVLAIKAYELSTKAAAIATTVWAAAQKVAAAAAKVWTGVQWLLNAALTANPIGIVVVAIGALVAALVVAYRNSDTFRAVVQKAWQGVQQAVSYAWNNVIKPAVAALVSFFRNQIAPTTIWLWQTIIVPAMRGIGAFIVATWNNVIKPTLNALVMLFRNVIAPTVTWLWKNIISPAFTTIGFIIKAAWAVIQVALAAFSAYIRNVLAPTITFLWRNVVAPTFTTIRGIISGAWDFIRPILAALGNFIRNTVAPGFSTGVNAIKAAWERLREVARVPVAFVVNSVINPLIGGFNKIAGVFGTTKVDMIRGFAEGGRIPGAPSSRDNRMAQMVDQFGRFIAPMRVATGEYIVNARATAEHLPLLNQINSGRGGSPMHFAHGGVAGFADGGLVGFVKNALGAFSDPIGMIKRPVEALLKQIPGSGLFRQVLAGMGRKLADGLTAWMNPMTGNAGGAFGNGLLAGAGVLGLGRWPSGPGAQRGDSGVWRAIVAMVRASGIPNRFGNGYRHGDPLWHGSGRAVDWSGYNQDALASFFMAQKHRVLELIHTTPRGGYYITRGRVQSSMGAQDALHRDHLHVAMAQGGLIPKVPVFDRGGVLSPGINVVNNRTGSPEGLTPTADLVPLLRELIQAVRENPQGLARELTGVQRGVLRAARIR